jgi:protein dispatched 1
MTNYLLMITWLPACISIADKLSCLSLKFNSITVLRLNIFKSLGHIGTKIEDCIVSIVLNLPYLCIGVLGETFQIRWGKSKS